MRRCRLFWICKCAGRYPFEENFCVSDFSILQIFLMKKIDENQIL